MITAMKLPDYKRHTPLLIALGCGAVALLLAQHGFAQDAAPAAADAAAPAAPPVLVPNKGDTAWMLTSTALVLLMSVPALALFYGGLVRTKNMLSVLMQVFVVFSLITVLWCVYGYSVAFTEGNAFFGGFSRLFLNGTYDVATATALTTGTFSKATPMYELVFVGFQATFAAITCCLILGSIVERIKFSAVLIFIVIWFTFSYLPVAHMVWYFAGPDAYTERRCGRQGQCHGRATSGSWARSISPAEQSCISMPVWPAWSALSCSASVSATARKRSSRTA